MITIDQYNDFRIMYDAGKFPYMRFGQAFMYILARDAFDPELFNAIDRGKAAAIIWGKYVDIGE